MGKSSKIKYSFKKLNDLNSDEIEQLNVILKKCSKGTVFNDIDLIRVSLKYFTECIGYVGYFKIDETIIGYLTYAQVTSNSNKFYYSPYQKSLIPYGGIVLHDEFINRTNDIIKLFINSFSEIFHLIYIKSNPAIDIRPIRNEKFKIKEIPTLLIDLDKSEDKLWASLQNRIRRNIKKAQRLKVIIKIVTPSKLEDIEPLALIYQELCNTKGLLYHSKEYYFELLHLINLKYGARIFYAIYDGQIISAMSVCFYNRMINPWFGGTLNDFVRIEAGSLLYWEIMKYGNVNGYRKFDFLGLDVGPIAFYKKGFGGVEEPVYHISQSSFFYKVKYRMKKWGI